MTAPVQNDMRRFRVTIDLAEKVRAALIRKGKREGWTACPVCGGKVRAVLAGPRNHLHMACETPSCIRMMQ